MFSSSRVQAVFAALCLGLSLPALAESPPGMTHHVRPMGSHVGANAHLGHPSHQPRHQGLAPRNSWPFWRQPPRQHYGHPPRHHYGHPPPVHHRGHHRQHLKPHHGPGAYHHKPPHHVTPPHHGHHDQYGSRHGRFVQKGRVLYLYGDHGRVVRRLNLGHREKWTRQRGRIIVYGGHRIRVFDRNLDHRGNLFVGNGVRLAFNHDHIVVHHRHYADLYDYDLRHLKRHRAGSGLHLSFH